MKTQIVTDCNEAEIEVGSHVTCDWDGVVRHGTVTEVTDFDTDYNDSTQRAETYPPRITIAFDDGTTETLSTYANQTLSWSDYPDGPSVLTFVADDLEVTKEER